MIKKDKEIVKNSKQTVVQQPDETTHLFVYGNITIRDINTKEVLVNKSF